MCCYNTRISCVINFCILLFSSSLTFVQHFHFSLLDWPDWSVLSKPYSFKSHPLKARHIHAASLYTIWVLVWVGYRKRYMHCEHITGIWLTFPRSSSFCKERHMPVIGNQNFCHTFVCLSRDKQAIYVQDDAWL